MRYGTTPPEEEVSLTKSYRFAALLGPAVLLNPAPNGVVAAGTSIAATGE